MNGLNYLLQSNLYLIIFFGFYWVLLRKETFNNYNRAYLVLSGLVSFAIPLWNLDIVQSWFITKQTTEAIVQLNLPEYVFSNIKPEKTIEKTMDITSYLSIVYGVGCFVLAVKLIMNIFNLYRFLYGITPINKAFSFFNAIFITEGLDPDDVIYNHERVHASQYHSFDVLLFEIIGIVCWFNPVIYLYKIAIKNIHEFIADDIASSKLPSKVEYAMFLFSEKFQTHPSVLVNNFFTKTSLKLRIEMLNKKRSNKVAVLKYGLIFPMFLGMMVFASAFIANGKNISDLFDQKDENIVTGKVLDEDKKPIPGASIVIKGANIGSITDVEGNFKIKLNDTNDILVVSYVGYESQEIIVEPQSFISIVMFKQLKSLEEIVIVGYPNYNSKDSISIQNKASHEINSEVLSVVEQNAEYPGGQQELNKFLQRNLRYPKEAQKNNVQGKVFAKFEVGANGDITNVRILKGMGSGLDEEAVRIIGKMPNWEPAKQNGVDVNSEFAMPISFVLEANNTEKPINQPVIEIHNIRIEGTPIYYLDYVEISLEKVKALDKAEIQSVEMLKGDIAIKKYGDKGKNGVVAITSSAKPIYILDGKKITKAEAESPDLIDKIESMTIVKGAFAITKYGDDGKNGVVVMTSKIGANKLKKSDYLGVKSKPKSIQDFDELFTVVEENAEFPGGQSALGKYLANNLKYPFPAQRANVQGKVFLSFVISKFGEISDIQVLKGLGFGCDEEAIRLVKSMPKWKPAKQSGREVNLKFNIPIAFVLNKVEFDKLDSVNGREYLFIIDGKEVSYETMKKTKLGKHKLTTFRDEESMKKYNAKGKLGVIIIETTK